MKFAKPHLLNRLTLCVFLVTATGCASTSHTACDSSSAQLHNFSRATQENHKPSSTSRDCANHNGSHAYHDSHPEKYCTFKRGLQYGEMGSDRAAKCSDHQWDEYENGYLTGRQVHVVNTTLEGISKELDALRSQLWELESNGETQASAKVQDKMAQIEQLKQQRDQVSEHLMHLKADTRQP